MRDGPYSILMIGSRPHDPIRYPASQPTQSPLQREVYVRTPMVKRIQTWLETHSSGETRNPASAGLSRRLEWAVLGSNQ